MLVNVAGLASLIVFYLLILAIGVGAAWYKRKRVGNEKSETNMVAGRDISILLGCFTMTGKIILAVAVYAGYIFIFLSIENANNKVTILPRFCAPFCLSNKLVYLL